MRKRRSQNRHDVIDVDTDAEEAAPAGAAKVEKVEVFAEETPMGAGENKRLETANSIIKEYMIYCGAAGFIPMPGFNWLAITAIQVRMLYSLSQLYDQSFLDHAIGASISALLGGFIPAVFSSWNLRGLGGALPIVGTAVQYLAAPVTAAATTYAVGQVFVQHFEAGGSLENFDPAAAREQFEKHVRSVPQA